MIVTRALELDERANRVLYAFGDYKANDAIIFQSKQLFFNSDAQRVRYRYVGSGAGDALREGTAAFYVPLPDSVLESDRRARERLHIPQVCAPEVSLRLPDGSVIRGILSDLSAEGYRHRRCAWRSQPWHGHGYSRMRDRVEYAGAHPR